MFERLPSEVLELDSPGVVDPHLGGELHEEGQHGGLGTLDRGKLAEVAGVEVVKAGRGRAVLEFGDERVASFRG